jgi:hypothetical protein
MRQMPEHALWLRVATPPHGSAQANSGCASQAVGTVMAGPTGRLCTVELGRAPTFGPGARVYLKSFFLFRFSSNLKINIYLNIALKFMKPIRLDS